MWRRILVPERVTLAQLHVILQLAMGWANSHLHEWEISRRRYGIPDEDWPSTEPMVDERRICLGPLIEAGMRRFTYRYDFGDDWEHSIEIEAVAIPTSSAPFVVCVAGENACPPEDVGGPPGYFEFLAAMRDAAHMEHSRMLRWIGGSFDPAAFDLADANARLATIKIWCLPGSPATPLEAAMATHSLMDWTDAR